MKRKEINDAICGSCGNLEIECKCQGVNTCIKCENPVSLCLCSGKPIKNYYSKTAKYQNMTIARAKACDVLETLMADGKMETITGEDWYAYEDAITKIISSK